MSKILSFNGRDVILASNPETKSLTIEAANYGLLSSDIIKALRNDKAEGYNTFATSSEVPALFNMSPPSDFPKFINTNGSLTFNRAGLYRFYLVGGGGAGTTYWSDSNSTLRNATATTVTISPEKTLMARPGKDGTMGSQSPANPPYDGTKGSVVGGLAGQTGENGNLFNGGVSRTSKCGGGAGSPLVLLDGLQISMFPTMANKLAEDAKIHGGPISADVGYGYGAGGGAACDSNDNRGGSGGNSGYLVIEEVRISRNSTIHIFVGQGAYSEAKHKYSSSLLGQSYGANGIVIIQWLPSE